MKHFAPLTRRFFLTVGLATLVLGGVSTPAYAQQMTPEDRHRLRQLRRKAIRRFRRRGDGLPQRARAAIMRGEIQPLRHLYAEFNRRSDAEILDIDLHETQGGWVYALRVLTERAQIRDLYFDARTLDLIVPPYAGDTGVPLPPGIQPPPAGQVR